MSGESMVGVVGLGGMGSGIAGTLVGSGHPTAVHDIDGERMKPLVERGASAAPSVAALCGACDVIILSLPTSHVAVEVMEETILPSVRPGTTVIDMGTTLVSETRRMAALLRAAGADLIDAPVSGGTAGARDGTLLIFAGGAQAIVEQHRSLLETLGRRVTYCGASGCGQITKAVNQLCMGLVDAAFLEAIALGVNGGVGAETLKQAIGGEEGFRAQFSRIADRVAHGEGEQFDVKFAEFGYFLDFAESNGIAVPMLSALASYMGEYPQTARDNMNRPYPPLWSALASKEKPS